MIHAFEYRGTYLVLDVESGAVHEVDKPSYEVISAIEQGSAVYALPYSHSLIDEILGEIEELKAQSLFDTPAPRAPKPNGAASPIKSMCLNVAHDCNLRCAYCFAETGEFHGGRMLMPFETAKAVYEASDRNQRTHFDSRTKVCPSLFHEGGKREKSWNRHGKRQ